MTSSNETDERWCTTPFATRTIRLNTTHEMILITMDMTVFFLNIVSSIVTMYIIKTTFRFKRKRCLWLIYHLSLNDIVFTLVTHMLYSVKLFNSQLACYYDLIFTFMSLSLANTSLALVLAISLLRLWCTKYLLQMNFMLTKRRSWYLILAAISFGIFITSLVTLGSVIGDVYLIHVPAALSDILVPSLIPLIYRKATKIANNRRCGSYFHKKKSRAEITLKRGMVATLITYLPFRLPFFASSTFKMLYTIQFGNKSNKSLQFSHSVCFLIFCMTPLGNAILYFLSDGKARYRLRCIISKRMSVLSFRVLQYANRRPNSGLDTVIDG